VLLKQIAGRRRLVAQLTRGAGQQRTGKQAIVTPDAFIGSEIGVAYQSADP
jgi:hypothetical protein